MQTTWKHVKGTTDIPMPFLGTDSQLEDNHLTHELNEETMECDVCCAARGSITFGWPCGAAIPRVIVSSDRLGMVYTSQTPKQLIEAMARASVIIAGHDLEELQ